MRPQRLILSIPILVLSIIWGCDNNDNPADEGVFGTFEEVLEQGGTFEEVPAARVTDTTAVEDPVAEDREETDSTEQVEERRYICTKKTLSVTDGNSEFPLFDSNSDVIYPGNLLQGNTLSEATPSPIVVKRAGGTISYDLNNGNLLSSFTVDEVKKSTIQTGMNTIIANAGDVVPANFVLDIVRVQSQEQLALEMGLKIKTWTTKASANVSFSTEREYNRFLVKLKQKYYTMSFDLPTSKDELFDESVTPQQLNTFVGPDNPATFISSVTYGRIFYMLVESTSSEQEMEARLSVSYGKFGNSISGELDVDSFKKLQNLKIKVIAYGGDAKGVFQLAGETSIENIANRLAESTVIESGLPLSYVVRSVERPDKIVGTNISTEFDIVDCDLKGVLPPQGYKVLVDVFEDGIGAMGHVAGSNLVIFNKAGDRYAWYNGNKAEVLGVFDLSDVNGPMGGLQQFDRIGALINFQENSRLYVFDDTGLKAEIFRYNGSFSLTSNELPTAPIGNYDNTERFVNDLFGDSGNFQFANRGFNASVRIGATKMMYFAKPGEEYAVYNRSGNGSWENPTDNSGWFPNATGGTLFDRVGAASFIEFGGSSGRWLFVNESGDELMEFFLGSNPKYEGPWVIK